MSCMARNLTSHSLFMPDRHEPTPATSRIEAENFSSIVDPNFAIAYNDSKDSLRGRHVTLMQKGDWLSLPNIDFRELTDGYLMLRVKADENTELCVREKKAKGKVISRIPIMVKGEQGPFRRDFSGEWITLTESLSYTPKNVADLVLTCEGQRVSIDWLQFKNRPLYFTPVAKDAPPSKPDEKGYIRRWRLMEPISKPLRSNIVFSNSWLRQTFAEELARLNELKAHWHTLESEQYNMKLFRFAEKYGKQTYGSLFWCETIIECPEELQGVRLSAGSNGASMWWVNGEEALLLEGDRRMVEDDGVSVRLTLHKGCNILRCAVINGPGLSDMCVRFLDENGNPITNFSLNVK